MLPAQRLKTSLSAKYFSLVICFIYQLFHNLSKNCLFCCVEWNRKDGGSAAAVQLAV